jgi:hypothetical protein
MKFNHIIGLMMLVSIISCKKIENGFQSFNVRYKTSELVAKRGLILYQISQFEKP